MQKCILVSYWCIITVDDQDTTSIHPPNFPYAFTKVSVSGIIKHVFFCVCHLWLFGGSDGEESTSNARDLGLIPGLGRSPGGRHGNPLQYSFLENPRWQRSLVGYSPWGCKESDTAEWLSTQQMFDSVEHCCVCQ